MWGEFKMNIVPIMPNWNACYSINNGEGRGEGEGRACPYMRQKDE
jgi:hypothetical protein